LPHKIILNSERKKNRVERGIDTLTESQHSIKDRLPNTNRIETKSMIIDSKEDLLLNKLSQYRLNEGPSVYFNYQSKNSYAPGRNTTMFSSSH
jgi:hypothetical protein